MKASYREMFDEVCASPKLREKVRSIVKQERKPRKIFRLPLISAAVVILIGTVAASITGAREALPKEMPVIEETSLRDCLKKAWIEHGGVLDGEQEQAIEGAVQNVRARARCNGIRLSVDEVYASERYLTMLLKIRGTNLAVPDSEWESHQIEVILPSGVHTEACELSMQDLGFQRDGTYVRLMELGISPEDGSLLEGAEVKLRLKDLHVFEDGEWVLSFRLEPTENQEVLTVEEAAGSRGEEAVSWKKPASPFVGIRKLQDSAEGFRFETEAGKPSLAVSLCLSDGTEVETDRWRGSGSGQDGPWEVSGRWPAPAVFSRIEAIRIGDVKIPLR